MVATRYRATANRPADAHSAWQHAAWVHHPQCHARAVEFARRAELALGKVPESAWKDAMLGLARYAIERTH